MNALEKKAHKLIKEQDMLIFQAEKAYTIWNKQEVILIVCKKNDTFDMKIRPNKPSPIYPNLGVYTKVCIAYKQVGR